MFAFSVTVRFIKTETKYTTKMEKNRLRIFRGALCHTLIICSFVLSTSGTMENITLVLKKKSFLSFSLGNLLKEKQAACRHAGSLKIAGTHVFTHPTQHAAQK